MGGGIRTSW